MLRREAASSFPGAGGPGRTLRGSPRAPVPGAPGLGSAGEREPGRGCRERAELPARRARRRRAFRFFWKFNWKKETERNTWQCHFVRIPRRGWNARGVALPGERFPSCPGTGGSAEGLPRGQRAGAEPTPWARQSCCRGFNPCSEPTGNFFFFCLVLGWVHFGSNYFVAFKNSTVTTFFYD